MRSALSGIVVSVGLLIMTLPANSHGAIVPVTFDSDASFLSSAGFSKAFGGNVRWGDAGGPATWELAVVDGSDIPFPGVERQAPWSPGPASNEHGLVFLFDGTSTASISLDLDSATLNSSWNAVPAAPAINAVFVRARAANGDMADLTSIAIQTALTTYSLGSLVGDADAEYVGVIAPELAQGFSLVANGILRDGNQSLPAYQLKVGVSTIPLPAGIWLLGSALGLLTVMRRTPPR